MNSFENSYSARQILVVDDDTGVRQGLVFHLADRGFMADGARDAYEANDFLANDSYDLMFLDIRMPGKDGISLLKEVKVKYPALPVVMMSGHGTIDTAISTMHIGACDFITKPIDLTRLMDAINKTTHPSMRLSSPRDNTSDGVVEPTRGIQRIVGQSQWSHRLRDQIRLVAEAKCDTVLILGETGTGKEVVARAIHDEVDDGTGEFVAVSCPALPDTLVESELFGHTKGAFTGATEDRAGCFEMANGGTLFLDEIGDLSPQAQAKILRALETRKIRRVGGTTEVDINVRVIAATNVELLEAAQNGTFRSDLYYRLNLFPIEMSALRHRPEDIVCLAEHFLTSFSAQRGVQHPGFSKRAEAALHQYDFPGNVRELKNMVERAAIMSGNALIEQRHMYMPKAAAVPRHSYEAGPPTGGDEVTRIRQALAEVRWNRKEASVALGIPYSTLRYKMEKYGIR